MSARAPQSSRIAFAAVKEILEMGEVSIPAKFRGNGAPGNTLEHLLKVQENNLDSPDLMDWEVKFHGGNALLTLFHKDPEPRGILNSVVDAFGWPNDRGQVSFRHTLSGSSNRGFKVVNEDDKIKIVNPANPSIVPFWEHDTIMNAIGAKLRRLILVHGAYDKDARVVVYNDAMAYWEPNLSSICKAIETGVIHVDFDARTKGARGTALRNHGTKFRIKVADIGKLYRHHVRIQ